jgi:PPM family protein phosphatase
MEEITAEYATEQIAAPATLRVLPRFTIACKTDLGRVRENNEDKYEFYAPEEPALLASRGSVFVVCDGMGGAEAGQIASELTTKTFIDVYMNHPAAEQETALRSAVAAANRFVVDVARAVPSRRGMGTTLSALVLVQDQAYTVQVGDSRVYRLRDGALEQLTEDHSWVDEAVKRGMITAEEALTHPYRHVLTRAVGTEEEVAPDVVLRNLKAGDIYLLCSDGLLNHVADDQIAEHLRSYCPSEAVWKLVGLALVNGGSDNCTIIVVRVDALESVGGN